MAWVEKIWEHRHWILKVYHRFRWTFDMNHWYWYWYYWCFTQDAMLLGKGMVFL
jgi:hypothetical protein